MKAILNKTIGPNFMAGDVIKGDYSRIKKLIDNGVATSDSSIIGMIGCAITWAMCGTIMVLTLITFWSHNIDGFKHYTLSSLWRFTILALCIYTIFKTNSQFWKGKTPYVAYFLAFITTIVGGILIMIGHERSSSRYQDRRTSSTAAIMIFSSGAIAIAIAILTTWHWNYPSWGVDDGVPLSNMSLRHWLVWGLYMFVACLGYSFAKFFDINFVNRRKRFIGFLRKKNVTIEYKTKALNYWRAYKETGNADKFMEKNIELLEESLEVDRQQTLGKNKK